MELHKPKNLYELLTLNMEQRFADRVAFRWYDADQDVVVEKHFGEYAQRKASVVDPQRNCILKAVHPSPLSAYRGFFGCRHFSRANEYLQSIGREPIRW